MAESPFKLLTVAVAALALLWIFFAYILPGFAPRAPLQHALLESLDAAEGLNGKVFSKNVEFRQGEMVLADALDSMTRSVNFRCMDVLRCCPRQNIGPGCLVAADERRLQVERDALLEVGFRCVEEQGLNLCTAYLGRKPAQLELAGVRAPREMELGVDSPLVSFKVKNAGQAKASDVIVSARVYRLSVLDGKPVEALHSGPVNREVGEIAPAGETGLSLPLEIREAGNYRVRLEARGGDAGKAVEEFLVKASGQPGEGRCKATVQGRDRLEAETCLQEFLCEGCEFDYECKLAWEPRLGEETIRDWSRASVWAEEPLEQCL